MALPEVITAETLIPPAERLSRRRQNNVALGEMLGHPVRLAYPAGGFDIHHLTIPSTKVMAIIDMTPFLFDESTLDNPYSPKIHALLENNNGHFLSLPHILTNSYLSQSDYKALEKEAKIRLKLQIFNLTLNNGYGAFGGVSKAEVLNDNFANTLACLTLMGVDFADVELGKFGNDFRANLMIDGTRKTVIFKDAELNEAFAEPGSPQHEWLKQTFNGFENGPTALIVKGDLNQVSSCTVSACNPDIIFGTGESLITLSRLFADAYTFSPIDTVPFPEERWGYKRTKKIQIGRKTAQSV